MNVKQEISRLKQQMKQREIADDGYYISRQYKEDMRILRSLEKIKNVTFG